MSLLQAGNSNTYGLATEETLQAVLSASGGSTYKASDTEFGDTSYYGFLSTTGEWYIIKQTATQVRYVKGASGYTTAWTNRKDVGTVYDYYDNVF